MADEIKVVITGKDGVSKVFQEVAKSADSMQKSIQKDATAAGTSLNKMSTDAKTAATSTSQSFSDVSRTFAVAGAAIGASLALFSRDIVTNQQNLATLSRTYGEAAGQIQSFAQQIQQSTTFSSEAAIESANTFGTLVRNYGLSVDQVQQLIQVSTDLAATSGLSLQDTSQRVAAAIRGEAESAELLGLTMNQQAIDRDNLTLSMSNQEAGQFRLNALLEQSAFAQGAAGDKAETTAGKIEQLNNKFQDLARGALDAAGPLPQIVSGITSVGASSGLAITGIASLAKGMREASTAAGGLKPLLSGLASSGLGTGLALGGLAVAAGVAFVATRELSRAFDGNFYQSLNKGNEVAADLNETISQLTGTMANAALALQFLNIDSGLDQVGKDMNRIKELQFEIAAGGDWSDHTTEGILETVDANNALQAELDALIAKYGDTEQAAGSWAAAQEDLGNVLIHASAGSELARARALELSQAFTAGEISLADYAWQLNWITENYAFYDQQALQAEVATTKSSAAQIRASEIAQSHAQAISDLTEQYGDLGLSVADSDGSFQRLWFTVNLGDFAARRAASGLNELGIAAEFAADPLGRLIELSDGLGEASHDGAAGVHDLVAAVLDLGDLKGREFGTGEAITRDFDKSVLATRALSDALKTATGNGAAFGAALAEQDLKAYAEQAEAAAKAVGLLDDASEQIAASGIKTPSLNLAVNTGGATDAVNGVYSAIVGATNKIGGQSQAIADWIGTITVGSDDAISKLEELRNSGQISEKTYRDAVSATNSVLADNADIQEDLLRIQAKQAPIIADVVHQQAAYVDSLADMDAKQQTVALGYLDQAEAAKALELAQLAAASSSDTMQASTTQMIQQAAAADPVLKAMLEDMGLLNAADGTVNFDTNAVDIGTAIQDLTGAVQELTDVIAQLPGIETSSNAAGTQKDVDGLAQAVRDIPDSSNTNITASDNASGTIQSVRSQLLALDGLTARTYLENYTTNSVNNVVTTTNVGPGTGATAGRLGGVMGYANGGYVRAELSEVGGELARFSNGGEAYIPNHGIYNVPVGTNILPAPATKAELSRRGHGDTFNIQSLTVVVQNGDLDAVMRSEALRQHRQR